MNILLGVLAMAVGAIVGFMGSWVGVAIVLLGLLLINAED